MELYGALYGELNSYGLPFTLHSDGLRSSLSAMLRSGLCYLAVAEEAGTIQGFLSAGVLRMDRKLTLQGTATLGMIHDLYLIPTCRGQGLAGRLLDDAEDWLTSQGVTMVECQVVQGNELGSAFWSRRGYAPVSVTRGKRLTAKEDSHVVSSD